MQENTTQVSTVHSLPHPQTLAINTMQLCMRHMRLFAGIFALYVLLFITLSVVVAVLIFLTNSAEISPVMVIGGVLWWIGITIISLWYQLSLLYAVGNTPADIYRSYDATRVYLWRYLLLIVTTTLGVFAGLLLFILPGIFLIIRWWFAPIVLIYEHTTVRDALAKSASLVRGRWWHVTGYLLIPLVTMSALLYVLGGLVAGSALLSIAGTILSLFIALFLWCMIPPCIFGYSYLLYQAMTESTAKEKQVMSHSEPEW